MSGAGTPQERPPKLRSLGFVAIAVVVLTSCDIAGIGYACTDISIPGISVTLVDSVSDSPLSPGTAVVTATDGAYADTARFWVVGPAVSLAFDRPGRYTVTVVAPGYDSWERAGVRVVMEDRCHVRTTVLTARLRPRAAAAG